MRPSLQYATTLNPSEIQPEPAIDAGFPGLPFEESANWRAVAPGDALVLANILRTDMHAHRPLPKDTDLARAVAVLARAQHDATWNRQQMSYHLRSLLREYYPAALDAFATWQDGLCRPEARELLKIAPTPAKAARLTRTQIQADPGRPQARRPLARHRGRGRPDPRGLPR